MREAAELSEDLVMLVKKEPELLNDVYREIGESLGIETAVAFYGYFRGQQISYPMRLLSPEGVRRCIIREYNGSNLRQLAAKYGYSEKSLRRILSEESGI